MGHGSWFDAQVRRRLAGALAVSLALPWFIGAFVKGFYTAGLTRDPEKAQLLIDFIAWGATAFGLSMVLTWLIGSWVTAVMKGPRQLGDEFPGAPGEPPR
jgi:hypothetical protein